MVNLRVLPAGPKWCCLPRAQRAHSASHAWTPASLRLPFPPPLAERQIVGDLVLELDESFGGGRLKVGDPAAGFKLEVDETKFEVSAARARRRS